MASQPMDLARRTFLGRRCGGGEKRDNTEESVGEYRATD